MNFLADVLAKKYNDAEKFKTLVLYLSLIMIFTNTFMICSYIFSKKTVSSSDRNLWMSNINKTSQKIDNKSFNFTDKFYFEGKLFEIEGILGNTNLFFSMIIV